MTSLSHNVLKRRFTQVVKSWDCVVNGEQNFLLNQNVFRNLTYQVLDSWDFSNVSFA